MEIQKEAIISALDYIEAHLCQPITVGEIAQAAGYSLFHFIRTFNRLVRHTPYDYLMRRRLSHAARLLLESDARVLEIALECQFESHEGFTRAFGRFFGMPPSAWREQGFHDRRRLMPPLGEDDLSFRENGLSHPPVSVQFEAFTLVGWMTPVQGDNRSEEQWQACLRAEGLFGEPNKVAEPIWSLRILPETVSQGEIWFSGRRLNGEGRDAYRYVIKEIPEGDYLCLTLEKGGDNPQAALRYLYHTFIPASGLSLSKPLEIVQQGRPLKLYVPVHNLSS